MSTYTETFDVHEYRRLTVTVHEAETEDQARELASMYVDLGEGRYLDGDSVMLEVDEDIQDSETETNDDGEWEPDEEEDDDEF